ncbi:MAG: fused MFS/spermidine synthase [Patescibacteria group bacterium]|nr:fused MFS/spermidine synthase [Patescibacteria group bacterium]
MFKENNYKKYLYILSFFCGMTIMAVEISASRLLAPYFGTSTFVWTNIIGVIMVALAIGYFVGGKLSDRRPDLNVLLKIILVSCIFLMTIPFITRPLVEFITGSISIWQSATSLIFIGSLLTVVILFIFPIILLGIVSPFIIKLLSLKNGNVGNDAGLVFSISTVGSIAGTFLPVLVFIPYLGTRKTILIFSLSLLVIAIIGLFPKKISLIFLLLFIPVIVLKMPAIKSANAVAEGESVYQYYQVADQNNFRYLKINEGMGVFSVLNKSSDSVLTDSYFDYYNILPYIDGQSKKQDVLILGLAGGTVSTQLNHFFANDFDLHIDGVEIDKKLIETAKKYFNLENPSLTIYNLDGRNFLDYYQNKYNAVVIDVYSNQLYISFHLTTKEFFDLVKNHLKPQGIVAMNVNATGKDSALLKNITNTMLLSFKNVYTVWTSNYSWNYLVIASDSDLDFKDLKNIKVDPQLRSIIDNTRQNVERVEYDNKFGFLTDDKAPIENLTDWMIIDYVYKNM